MKPLFVALLITTVVLLLALVACGARATDQDRADCEQDGGTFIKHSDGGWECVYDLNGDRE